MDGTSASDQAATDVNGEIELNQTGSGRLADASAALAALDTEGAGFLPEHPEVLE